MTANPDQLTPVLEAKLKNVVAAITSKPPLCSGTWEIPTESFQLCFKNGDNNAEWLDFLKATETQLESLAKACALATFGANNKDVLDLSYRKAGKMDVTDFMARFDPESLGLSEFVRGQLLEGEEDLKGMRTELYKLNVYGKDSFFKSHKDTPRSVDMIGSLVVIFPTTHKGGALVLRHDGQEYTFDSGLELSRIEKPSIAYVAFYSDVEHEVTIVETGYRVTLTYNLYVSAPSTTQQEKILSTPSNVVMPNELKLKQALSDLLDEKTFLPEGGTIGIGILHKYPVSKSKGSIESVLNCLKGTDSALRRVCASLGVELKPKVIYKEKHGEVLMMMDEFIELPGFYESTLESFLCRKNEELDYRGSIVKSRGLKENGAGEYEDTEYDYYDDYWYQEVWWLTKRTELTRERTDFVAYGNDPELTYTYGDVVLIAKVGGHANRQAI